MKRRESHLDWRASASGSAPPAPTPRPGARRSIPAPAGIHLAAFPPKERWDDWVELDSRAWPERVEKHSTLVPTTCFNCESACGLLAYVDPETLTVRKFEGNPEHPGSRGRNCAKGPATHQPGDRPRPGALPAAPGRAPRLRAGWSAVSWDEALDDIAARIRQAIARGPRRTRSCTTSAGPARTATPSGCMASWGVDGHNSHTNVCSSRARAPGYHLWMRDRPAQPRPRQRRVIFLISSHLEAGHYFNPHAQRIMEAKANGAKLIVVDTRLSNTATHADWWLSPYPGSRGGHQPGHRQPPHPDRALRPRVRPALVELGGVPGRRATPTPRRHLRGLRGGPGRALRRVHLRVRRSRVGRRRRPAARGGRGGGRRRHPACRTHNWRSAAAGNLGGWQVSRTLFLLNALLGAVATAGWRCPQRLEQVRPRPIHAPAPPARRGTSSPGRSSTRWPLNELSFLLPHFLKEGRGRLEVYFTRVYNPVWTNPDGFSWIEALTDEDQVGLPRRPHPDVERDRLLRRLRAARWATRSERHDLHSYETVRRPVGRVPPAGRSARPCGGRAPAVTDTRESNPGEVWEENEFWIELSWRIDPDGSLGIRQHHESRAAPRREAHRRRVLRLDVRALRPRPARGGGGRRASARSTTCAATAPSRSPATSAPRLRGAGPRPEPRPTSPRARSAGSTPPRSKPPSPNAVPLPTPDPDPDGRRPVGVGSTARSSGASPPPRAASSSGRPRWPSGAGPRTPSRATSAVHIHPENLARTGHGPAHLHLPAARPDPHPLGQLQVARRDRPHQPAVDPSRPTPPSSGCAPATSSGSRRRSATTWSGLGHRGHPARRRGLQPPHGPLEADGAVPGVDGGASGPMTAAPWPWAAHDGHRRPGPGRSAACGGARRRALRVLRPGHPADLVDRRRRPPEPHLRRPSRPDLRAALLAPGRAGHRGRARRPPRRHRRRHRQAPTPPTAAGWSSPAAPTTCSPDGTRRPYWLLRPLKPAREEFQLDADSMIWSR